MKQIKTKKPDFGDFPPPRVCTDCDGQGNISLSIWSYKKCLACKGTGKNAYICTECSCSVHQKNGFFWCANENCKHCGIVTALSENIII